MNKSKLKNSIYSYFKKIHSKNSGIGKKHFLHEATYNQEEVYEATKIMASTFVTMGKKVKKFENEYSRINKSDFSLMCNSGSSANLLMISTIMSKINKLGLKKNDEVIVPSLSWSTTVWPIIQCGLIPVFVDCDPQTYNLNIEKLNRSISKKTKAILLVHVYGNPCEMDKIEKICKKHKLILLEDCCEAMGAKFKGKNVGNFGLISSFSLYFSHHITSLEGGICCTNNKNIIENLRIQRAHGWSRETENKDYYIKKYPKLDPRFIFVDLGYNLRPTEVQGAIASIQLKKLNKIINKRRKNYSLYLKYLKKINGDKIFIQKEEKKSSASWFGLAFTLNSKKYPKLKRDIVSKFLNKNKIENRPIIAGNIAKHPVMNNYKYIIRQSLNESNNIMQNGIGLGLHQSMKESDIIYISNKLIQIIQELTK